MKKVLTGPFLHIIFLAVLVLFRAWLSHSVGYLFYPDSETYELLSRELLSNSDVSIPVRPLGYPLFLWSIFKTAGLNHAFVVYAQQALGIANYFLYFSIFKMVSGRKAFSAAVAFIVSISGVAVTYELAIMSDSLNLFFIVLSVFFFLKAHYKGGSWLLLPAGAVSAAAFIVRPTSLIFPACMAAFLVFMFFRALFTNDNARAYLKGFVFLVAAFIAVKGSFDMATGSLLGIRGHTVGVGGLSLFVKSSDFIDYSSPKHAAVKRRFREINTFFRSRMEPKSADIRSGYTLIPDIRCESAARLDEYRKASASSDRFFGPHQVGSDWFTIYSVLGKTGCDIDYADKVLSEVAIEAMLSHPGGYFATVANEFVSIPGKRPDDYLKALGKAHDRGDQALSFVLIAFYAFKLLFENALVNFAVILSFAASGVYFALRARRGALAVPALLFSTVFLNVLMLAALLNYADPRYNLSFHWIEVFLFFLFLSEVFSKRAARTAR